MTERWTAEGIEEDRKEHRRSWWEGIFIGYMFGLLLGVGLTLLAADQHWLVFP